MQLGARFGEVKKSAVVVAVETFNSTKKKMGICFRVSFTNSVDHVVDF